MESVTSPKAAYDVIVVGGGPAGSTVGAFLKKYRPKMSVGILEREVFPRDHVGESQLPTISYVLDEIGVWDKVEAAGFPVKIGATYRWGRTKDLWDFEFVDDGVFHDVPRPAKFNGQRRSTAFQVDRAIYDEILLNHAAGMGCEVFQDCRVLDALIDPADPDRIISVTAKLGDREPVEMTAKYFVDCSGHSGILRRKLNVPISEATKLQNVAFWDYWQNADWAVKIGIGGTRIQILSLEYGWLWFIPLGPTRTSIGLVLPKETFQSSGRKPREIYMEAIQSDPLVKSLLANATCENIFSTTKDWSFISDRLCGANWFLAGESAGFADPILSAGMTLAHVGAREVAYTIIEMERKILDDKWLRTRYSDGQRRQIESHIKFADFWYSSNGVFQDLKDFTQTLASDAGLDLNSDDAWRWFGRGGFIDYDSAQATIGGYGFSYGTKLIADFLGKEPSFEVVGKTHFWVDLSGAEKSWGATMGNGEIRRHRTYLRNGKAIPTIGLVGWLIELLKVEKCYGEIIYAVGEFAKEQRIPPSDALGFQRVFVEALEALRIDGWLKVRTVEGFEGMRDFQIPFEGVFHPNRDRPEPTVAEEVAR